MKRMLKKLSMIGLAVALILSLCLGVAACGGPDGSGNISVSVFCTEQDRATYQDLIDTWEQEYAAQLRASDPDTFGKDFVIDVEFNYNPDNIKYFNTLSDDLRSGSAPDLFYISPGQVQTRVANGYILDLSQYIDFSDYAMDDFWGDALGMYAYNPETGTIGQNVTYNAENRSFSVASTGEAVGMYGLPKDYSSFSMAYNANFFTQAFKDAYESKVDTQGAAWVYGTTPAAGTVPTTSNATPSVLINPGVTITYYPYNYYNYKDLKSAYDAKDPVAVMSVNNGGYDVTIPCYPNDYFTSGTDNSATVYDDTIVYPVYTYAEFSALGFAVSYYETVYDSGRDNSGSGAVESNDYKTSGTYALATWLDANQYGVYANDTYDYKATYYLTPWLAGNDTSIINDVIATKTATPSVAVLKTDANGNIILGTDGQPEYVTRDDPEFATSDYGINSERFIETYAAFLAYGSDWNNNMFYTKSTLDSATIGSGGFAGLTAGYEVFYGFGTWDSSNLDTDKSVLDYQIMTTPISEDFAYYSRVKNMDYNSEVFGKNQKGTTDATAWDVEAAMTERQTEWAARIDSVGFAVNSITAEKYTGEYAWKLDAVLDLCAYLSVDTDSQVKLTYAGSQMPNYRSLSGDYINAEGEFAGIISPGHEIWATAQEAALKLAGLTRPQQKKGLIVDWLEDNYPELLAKDADGNYLYFNDLYEGSVINTLNEQVSRAFRLFNMSALTRESRNLLIRMAETNGFRDPCMYTFDSDWWQTTFATYEGYYLMNYNLDANKYDNFDTTKSPIAALQTVTTEKYNTPYNYCIALAPYGETNLRLTVAKGQQEMG